METKNPKRIKVREVAEREGMNMEELMEEYALSDTVPACCEDGCKVEPDGHCPHGCPSILLAMGII
jgi:hypothetical protein